MNLQNWLLERKASSPEILSPNISSGTSDPSQPSQSAY